MPTNRGLDVQGPAVDDRGVAGDPVAAQPRDEDQAVVYGQRPECDVHVVELERQVRARNELQARVARIGRPGRRRPR